MTLGRKRFSPCLVDEELEAQRVEAVQDWTVESRSFSVKVQATHCHGRCGKLAKQTLVAKGTEGSVSFSMTFELLLIF